MEVQTFIFVKAANSVVDIFWLSGTFDVVLHGSYILPFFSAITVYLQYHSLGLSPLHVAGTYILSGAS